MSRLRVFVNGSFACVQVCLMCLILFVSHLHVMYVSFAFAMSHLLVVYVSVDYCFVHVSIAGVCLCLLCLFLFVSHVAFAMSPLLVMSASIACCLCII